MPRHLLEHGIHVRTAQLRSELAARSKEFWAQSIWRRHMPFSDYDHDDDDERGAAEAEAGKGKGAESSGGEG